MRSGLTKSKRKSVLLRSSASLVVIASAIVFAGCAGPQYSLSEGKSGLDISSNTALKPHVRYGFTSHGLDTEARPDAIVKLADAGDIRNLPPTIEGAAQARSLPAYSGQFVPPQPLSSVPLFNTIMSGTIISGPQLRQRFQYQLDGTAPIPAGAISTPIQATPVQAIPNQISISAPQNIAPNAPRQNAADAFTIQNAPTLSQVTQSANAAPNTGTPHTGTPKTGAPAINAYETTRGRRSDLSVPELPEEQRRVILQEQAALARLQNKTVLAGSESLQSSLDSAFARSSRLAADELRIDEAEETLTQAKARSKLQAEFRAAAGPRASETTFAFDGSSVDATTFRRSGELDLNLPIYQGGRLRAERSSAEAGINTARANVSQTRGAIIEQTAIAYLDVVRDRKLVNLYQENVNLLQSQQSSMAELVAQGENTIADKALVDAQFATQAIRLETGLGTLDESEARYKNLTGKPAANTLPVPRFDLPLSLTEIQALAQQNNPEITSLISQAKSAEFDVDIAKSGGKPTLGLQGILRGAEGQSETIDRNTAAELLLNLRVPITSGGENSSRVRQAKIVRNRINLEIRDTQDNLRDQVERLWARRIASEKSLSFNAKQISATQTAVNTVAEQRAENVATILDLLAVQQTLLDARIQNIEAESRRDTASIQLLNLMGVYQ